MFILASASVASQRVRPSTRARTISYSKMKRLFGLLEKLGITHPYGKYDDDTDDTSVDYKGWKEWTNKYTPPDKRGGPSNHTPRVKKCPDGLKKMKTPSIK